MKCCLFHGTCTAAALAAPTGHGAITICISYDRFGPNLAAYQRGTSQGIDAAAEGALLPPGRVARSEFTSNKLAPKLAQQLKVRQLLLWLGAVLALQAAGPGNCCRRSHFAKEGT